MLPTLLPSVIRHHAATSRPSPRILLHASSIDLEAIASAMIDKAFPEPRRTRGRAARIYLPFPFPAKPLTSTALARPTPTLTSVEKRAQNALKARLAVRTVKSRPFLFSPPPIILRPTAPSVFTPLRRSEGWSVDRLQRENLQQVAATAMARFPRTFGVDAK